MTKRESNKEAVAWEAYLPGCGSVNSETRLTRFEREAQVWAKDGWRITPLFTSPQQETEGREITEGWQPIETIPHDGEGVMVWISEDDIVGPHCYSPLSVTEEGWWWDDSTGDRIEPIKSATHWMPLPAKPDPAAGG